MKHLRCPVCQQNLRYQPDDRVLRCEQGHSFDRAKQGYFNLLLNQHKKSKQPGDTAEMVAARHEFLETGAYQAIIDTATALLTEAVTEVHSYCDLACGEGYYTQHLHAALNGHGDLCSTGIDISTPAIKTAARRSKQMQWLVGSIAHAPIQSESQDVLSCMFCRLIDNEALRILKPDGLLLLVDTAPAHLWSLRSVLYPDIKGQDFAELPTPKGLTLIKEVRLTRDIQLTSPAQIANLLKMTPHFWRSTQQAKDRVYNLDRLDTQIDVHFRLFRKQAKHESVK
ncbi:MAG: methyltransferase domain-containing protein [Oleiphilaceae bacterium]|nr:methyltransferase domain-containing protein [Oleiphilaceae bacterium]